MVVSWTSSISSRSVGEPGSRCIPLSDSWCIFFFLFLFTGAWNVFRFLYLFVVSYAVRRIDPSGVGLSAALHLLRLNTVSTFHYLACRSKLGSLRILTGVFSTANSGARFFLLPLSIVSKLVFFCLLSFFSEIHRGVLAYSVVGAGSCWLNIVVEWGTHGPCFALKWRPLAAVTRLLRTT